MTKHLPRTIISALMLLWGAQGSAEDLIDIYNAAVDNDPVFQSQAYILQAEREGPASARADLRPSVRLHASRSRNDDEVTGPGAFGAEGSATFDTNQYGASVTQTLYNRDRFLNYEQAQLRAEVAEIEFSRARQDLILRVVSRYLDVLSAQDNLELAVAERRAIFRQLELARSRLEVGLGTSTDLHDAMARYELSQAQEIRAQQTLEDANQALEELIGRRIETLAGLREDSPLNPPTPNEPNIWVERSRAGNLELMSAALNEEISRQEISRQKARRMPTLDLVVSHDFSEDDGSIGGDVERTSTAARILLEIPIYQGGGISADSRAASVPLSGSGGADRIGPAGGDAQRPLVVPRSDHFRARGQRFRPGRGGEREGAGKPHGRLRGRVEYQSGRAGCAAGPVPGQARLPQLALSVHHQHPAALQRRRRARRRRAGNRQ
jgi:outer membrane protein